MDHQKHWAMAFGKKKGKKMGEMEESHMMDVRKIPIAGHKSGRLMMKNR